MGNDGWTAILFSWVPHVPEQKGVWKSRKPESGIGMGMGTGTGTGTGTGNGKGTVTAM